MIFNQSEILKNKKTVVIIGAGFAGLNAAKKLAKSKSVYVYLIDERNFHLFQPLLYQVATAGLNPSDIAVPVRTELNGYKNVTVHMGKATKVDLQNNIVFFEESSDQIQYNYLVIACGAKHSYFGNNQWEEVAPGLKTIEDATEIRKRILIAFEKAENETDLNKIQKLLRFVVIGAGPTGVELAGAIAEISTTVLKKDFKRIDASKAQVILVEAGERVLSAFDKTLSKQAEKDLKQLGVTLKLGSRVTHIDQDAVVLNSSETIDTNSVFWAAGVEANKINFKPIVETDYSGRIFVEKDLSLKEYKNVFIIGDMASVDWSNGRKIPGVAPAANQMGLFVARTIIRELKNKERSTFVYFDKGMMATIGKNRAVVEGPNQSFKFSGRLAWFAWLFVHILYLVGFKNRAAVFLTWTWSYLCSTRGARLITETKFKFKNRL